MTVFSDPERPFDADTFKDGMPDNRMTIPLILDQHWSLASAELSESGRYAMLTFEAEINGKA
jgi:hypothetical protein